MNLFAIVSAILLLSTSSAAGQDVTVATNLNQTEETSTTTVLSRPENLLTDSASNAVAVFWNPVEGAAQYFASLSDNQTQFVMENRVAFGGLESNTEYTVTIAAVDGNGVISPLTASITITTLSPRVQNLRFVDATDTAIEVTWETREGTTGYNIRVTTLEDETVEVEVSIENTTAIISGLQTRTFYNIIVEAMTAQGPADTAVIRARTDGSGIEINAVWENSDGLIGGEAMIYRPISIPIGTYTIIVTFQCSLAYVRVWNADLDDEASNATIGNIVIRQTKMWQRTKTEIGMNFYFSSTDRLCDLNNNTISAQFGVDTTSDPADNATEEAFSTFVPTLINEWRNTSLGIVQTGGLVEVRLMDVYDHTSVQVDASNPKPPIYEFVIAVSGGTICPGGINVRHSWSMTQKAVTGIQGIEAGTAYFVQQGSDWYSNEAGFVYGYNPMTCPSRNAINARVLEGGPIVQEVLQAQDVPPVY